MTELNKYEQIKKIREKIRDLSFNLGDLVNVLDSELIEDDAKEKIEEQAWKLVDKMQETIKKETK